MDVFTGQMTNAVLKQSQDNNIFIINVARNMTKCHQPLDITVNEYYNRFLTLFRMGIFGTAHGWGGGGEGDPSLKSVAHIVQ